MIPFLGEGPKGRGLDAAASGDYPLVVRAVSLLLLLAVSVSAQEAESGLRAQKARELVESLPAEARVELKKMYRRYKDAIARKLESGWSTGVLSEAVIEDVDEPFQPARLLETDVAQRKQEAASLKETLDRPPDESVDRGRVRRALEKKRQELAVLTSRNKREKGICRDWSDLVWSELVGMELEYWGARDERRATRPYHTAAIVCSPADSPLVCLAFDPWEDGRPNVYAYTAWDESAPGGRFPAEYFLHDLPDRVVEKPAKKAGKKP
jgi:hypothetical protein